MNLLTLTNIKCIHYLVFFVQAWPVQLFLIVFCCQVVPCLECRVTETEKSSANNYMYGIQIYIVHDCILLHNSHFYCYGVATLHFIYVVYKLHSLGWSDSFVNNYADAWPYTVTTWMSCYWKPLFTAIYYLCRNNSKSYK